MARLEAAGFEAYAVGGCVRDSLLGREVHDWDLCSAATPQQATELFSELRVLPTGIEHGTVTLLWEHEPLELTMFRTEADYDGRAPRTVRPARTIDEDLQRRDFTVNAMAYSPTRGLVDLYGGQEDLAASVLRAVGEPSLRFREDYLRVLRALRFSANYGLTIEKNTASAMRDCADGLRILSGERVWQELSKLLLGEQAGAVLAAHGGVLRGLGGGWEDLSFSASDGQALDASPKKLCGRLALLLHKNLQKTAILEVLRCPSDVKKRVSRLWERAENLPADSFKEFCRWLHGFERTNRAEDWEFAWAIGAAHRPSPWGEGVAIATDEGTVTADSVREIIGSVPLDICDLPITGADLLAAGVPKGPIIGETLEKVLEMEWEQAAPSAESMSPHQSASHPASPQGEAFEACMD